MKKDAFISNHQWGKKDKEVEKDEEKGKNKKGKEKRENNYGEYSMKKWVRNRRKWNVD